MQRSTRQRGQQPSDVAGNRGSAVGGDRGRPARMERNPRRSTRGRSARRSRRMDQTRVSRQPLGQTPAQSPPQEQSKQELYAQAKQLNIAGRSHMSREELQHAIDERRRAA